MSHRSVLLQELIDGVSINPGSIFVDATLGLGGHSRAAAERLGKGGILVGIDRDEQAIRNAQEVLRGAPCTVHLVHGTYRDLDAILVSLGIRTADRIIFDLGLNSEQLELSGRGFSFQKTEPLLMTFMAHPGEGDLTAREIVNTWEEENIADIIYGYGEERFARRIARAIVARRSEQSIETTSDLVAIIEGAVPSWAKHRRIHPATKTFQALRITVNDEIEGLRIGLRKAVDLLPSGGRVGVIAFHSIEDRIVKRFFAEKNREGAGILITKKPITPSYGEKQENPRSRSAKLRIFEKM
jgi:16S rRNA (cytosine1402-N4)-methyltransferase